MGLVLLQAGDLEVISGLGSALQGEALAAFEAGAKEFGLPYGLTGERLRMHLAQ